MFIVANESAVMVRGQGGLSCPRKAKEHSHVPALALIGGRMKSQDVVLNGHLVEQNSEDALLHLSGILRPQNNHLLIGKVDGYRGRGAHASGEAISRK